MQLTPDQLAEAGYEPSLELSHKELAPFVQAQLRKRTFLTGLYLSLNLGLLAFMVGLASWQTQKGLISWHTIFTHFSYGLALGIGLLFPHEALHAIAYKLVGARQVSFGGQWRQFIFYALANRFVANQREFLLVAFTPFSVLSAGLAIAFLIATLPTSWSYLGALFVHTALCSGDFALAGYMRSFPHKADVLTYDDTAAQTTYFFTRPA